MTLALSRSPTRISTASCGSRVSLAPGLVSSVSLIRFCCLYSVPQWILIFLALYPSCDHTIVALTCLLFFFSLSLAWGVLNEFVSSRVRILPQDAKVLCKGDRLLRLQLSLGCHRHQALLLRFRITTLFFFFPLTGLDLGAILAIINNNRLFSLYSPDDIYKMMSRKIIVYEKDVMNKKKVEKERKKTCGWRGKDEQKGKEKKNPKSL